MAWTEQCKIDAVSQINHIADRESISFSKAIKALSLESGIPVGTLKRWFFHEKERFNNELNSSEMNRPEDIIDNYEKTIKRLRTKNAQLEKRFIVPPEWPEGKYKTIIIDPPWPMEKILRHTAPEQAEFDYPVMTVDEIQELPIETIAEDNCHLFVWTTQKFIPQSYKLLRTWGFKYVLNMIWHKSGGFQPVGLPQFNCEFVVYGRKGNIKFLDGKDFPCCFTGERREHSRKPVEFYDLIRRVTEEPRIDMFSREKLDGFDQYGNETENF